MMRRRKLLRLVPALPAGLAGCRNAPPAQYYRLAPVPGAALDTAPASLRVRSIFIPDYLNQSGIAEPSGAYQFTAAANALWAGPLPGMLQTVMVQDLAQRLPQMTVTGSNGMIGTPADLAVEINVLRFDPDASGRVILNAQFALRKADGTFLFTRAWQKGATPASAGFAPLVETMSRLWGGLAGQIAQAVASRG